MSAAFGAGILVNDPGGNADILIDRAFWYRMDYPAKVAFMERFTCAVVGPGKALSSINVKSKQSGRVLATWRLGQLDVR